MVWFTSTAILRAEYDAEARVLTLWFKESGGPYDLHDVPEEVFAELCEAPSQGRYYNKHIRDRYEVSPPD